jgi:hypothetical protein
MPEETPPLGKQLRGSGRDSSLSGRVARKTRFRGLDRVGWMFTFAAAAYNLVRMRNLQAATA